MDIKTLRWQKTRKLVSEAGGISRFAEKIGRSQQQANRFAGPNPVAGIGNKIARLIEDSFGLPANSLDKQDYGPDALLELDKPATTPVEAIRQAAKAAELFVTARRHWLTTRPQAFYLVRSALRRLLIDNEVEIISEHDASFDVLVRGNTLQVDLFIPLPGFAKYRYESRQDMALPDVLAVVTCLSEAEIGFYLLPESVLNNLPDNQELSLNESGQSMNDLLLTPYLNNTTCLR